MVVAHRLEEALVGGLDLPRHGVAGRQFRNRLASTRVECLQHIVGETPQLHSMLFHQLLECLIVARGEFVEHVLVHRPGRLGDDSLQVRRQCLIGVTVDDELQHRTGLVPARVVVVLRHLVQAQGQVVVGTDPLGGIDHAGLQRGIDLPAGDAHRGAAGGGENIPRQSRNAHLDPLQVLKGIDLGAEPASHLHAGAAPGKGNDVRGGIGFPPQFQAAAVVQPAIHFLGGHAKGHRGEVDRRGNLALPVIGGPVAGIRHPLAHRVEDLEGGHHLPGPVDVNRHAAAAHLGDHAGEVFRRRAQAGQVLGPGGDQFPVEVLLGAALHRDTGTGRPRRRAPRAVHRPEGGDGNQGRQQQQDDKGGVAALDGGLGHGSFCLLVDLWRRSLTRRVQLHQLLHQPRRSSNRRTPRFRAPAAWRTAAPATCCPRRRS